MKRRESSKRRLCIFAIILIFIFCVKNCSADPPQIGGKITEYHRVEEYTSPIATVVDDKGNISYIAMMCEVVTNNGVFDQKSMNALRNGRLLGADIQVTDGCEGKTIKLNEETITVYQAFRIAIIDTEE